MKKLFIPLLALVLSACDRQMKYPVHQVPAGYEGHVVVIFGQPGFPELPTNRKNQFLQYPADGILITSSSQRFGLTSDQALESTSRVGDFSVRAVAKVRQFESGGTRERDGIKMPFLVKAVGSDAYWRSRNPSDYTAKVAEAERKLRREMNRGGAGAAAGSEQP